MFNRIKLISLLACICMFIPILSSCYDSNEIEDLAYVIAMGIDEAEDNSFNLTFQLAVPKSIASTEAGGESTKIISFKTDNFLSGIKKANENITREINLSHTKIIVVSEKIAKRGITAFLNGLQNYTELRPNIHIIVSSKGAKEYIESIQPQLSSNTARYYDLLFKSYASDFLVPDTNIEDYLYRTKNVSIQPVAIYTAEDKAINESKPSKEEKEGGGSDKKEGDKKAKNLSIQGLAVFKEDKMVGKLKPEEATLFALLTNSINNVRIEVVDPLDKKFKVLGRLYRNNNSTTNVSINGDKPRIDINLKMNIQVEAVQSDNDYAQPKNMAKLKKAYEDYLNKGINNMLNKIIKEYKSDIFGFGEIAKRKFLTIDQWKKAKWTEKFPNAQYNLILTLDLMNKG